jgi:hypothetical protein
VTALASGLVLIAVGIVLLTVASPDARGFGFLVSLVAAGVLVAWPYAPLRPAQRRPARVPC